MTKRASHTALARRYRPTRFADVTTQEHVSETLRHAVAAGRVGHAYLFCGPRGVGKTTLARVLAMALNCPRRTAEGEPCGTCESCTRIWSGHTSLDVVEIDAASNRGVDDARDLRERAMYAPSAEDRFKVYIVDEAHMLTREAWNALLKILEEPPPRLVFVFATTEPQKIQQTAAPILSRCQRFDFRRVAVPDIVGRLRQVLESEGMSGADDALRLIARKADGGMRDALSLADQVLSLTGGEITVETARRVLGLVEEERYLELFDVLAARRHGDVFPFVEGLVDEGYDLVEFYHGLVEALRVLLRLRLGGGETQDLREELREEYRARAEAFEAGDLLRMLALAAELETAGSLRRSAQPRMLVELLLVRFSYLDRTIGLEELIGTLGGVGDDVPPSPAGSPPSTRPRGRAREAARAASRPDDGGAAGSASPDAAAAPAGPKPARAASPEAAWERLLEEGTGVPNGLSPFLRAATIVPEAGGRLRLSVPEGPGLERLRDPLTLRILSDALGVYLDGDSVIVLDEPGSEGAGAPSRITEETVRADRLRAQLAREPRLEPAVEELDLELLD